MYHVNSNFSKRLTLDSEKMHNKFNAAEMV